MHSLETIAEDFQSALNAAFRRLRCVGLATVKKVNGSIDSTITLSVRLSVWREDGEGEGKAPPEQHDVPLFCFNAGGWGVRMLPSVGDKVLLLVSDDALTEWKSKKDADAVVTKDRRSHAFTDALAIPFAHATNTATAKMLIGSLSGAGPSIELTATGTTINGNVDVTGLLRVGTAVPGTAITVNTHTHAVIGSSTDVPNPG